MKRLKNVYIQKQNKRRIIIEFEKLKEIIIDVLNANENVITMETTFVDDLGADSLDVFQIIMGIEEAFEIEIEPKTLKKSLQLEMQQNKLRMQLTNIL